jgi:hypothetical protein
MTLPKIQHPTFELTVPSTKAVISYRPFLVKEEKILLIAQQSEEDNDMLRAIKQIINNCVIDSSLDVDKLATFDIEYIFLKIRSKSVNNIVNVTYKDNEDEELYDFEINLDEIEIKFPENKNNKLKISENLGLVLKYPTSNIIDYVKNTNSESDLLDAFIMSSIDYVYDEENVYPFDENTKEEKKEFIDSLDIKTFNTIREFLENLPKLSHTLTYTNKKGNEVNIKLESLRDFFTLG